MADDELDRAEEDAERGDGWHGSRFVGSSPETTGDREGTERVSAVRILRD
ncbi:hypothetical protein DM2_2699 [Halorubrum sp. DM2]|nr:hypothetical protein DM2_2699 [Halorubrum sp. DM2]